MRRLNPSDNTVLNEALRSSPLTFIDVGAAGGLEPLWAKYLNLINIQCYGFEASPKNFKALIPAKNVQYFPYAISDEVGQVEFFNHGTVGSLHERKDRVEKYGEVYDKIQVKAETLANMRDQDTLIGLDALKIDVEGHEFAVLKGCGNYLASETLYVKSEFSFQQSGGNNFSLLDTHLKEHGFFVFSFNLGYSKLGNVLGGDCLHLKNINFLINSSDTNDIKRMKILKLITISIMCHHMNYAYYCAFKAHSNGLLSKQDFDSIKSFVTRCAYLPIVLPQIFSSPKIARIFFLVTELFQGPFRHKQGSPKENDVHNTPRLWVDRKYLPKLLRKKGDDDWLILNNVVIPK